MPDLTVKRTGEAGHCAPKSTLSAEQDYGEEGYALTSSEEKLRFLAALLTPAGDDVGDPGIGRRIVEKFQVKTAPADYVSTLREPAFPLDRYQEGLDEEFLTEYAALLTDPRVAILGGRYFPEVDKPETIDLEPIRYSGWTARKDTVDGTSWWVLFNYRDGTKLRVNLHPDRIADGTGTRNLPNREHQTLEYSPAKAATPELVDIKLTDRCPFQKDCGWCYMASTTTGPEGDPGRVMRLLDALADLRVFEVAFGGGEPTVWPHLTETLAYARTLGIVPNFTTKNYAWLNGTNGSVWLDLVGSVAFSVNTADAMTRLTSKVGKAGLDRFHSGKITVQLIPDLVPDADFATILTEAGRRGWRVTLLGYKHTGRGATFTPQFRREPGWWLARTASLRTGSYYDPAIAIDTLLAEQSRAALDAHGVPEWLYHLTEGAFSAYVDTVSGQMGPSSYAGPGSLTPIDLDTDTATLAAAVRDLFATYPGEPAQSDRRGAAA